MQVVTDVGGATLTARVLGAFAPDDLAVISVTSAACHPQRPPMSSLQTCG